MLLHFLWTNGCLCEHSMKLSTVSVWHCHSGRHRDTCLSTWGCQGQHWKPGTWTSSCWHGAFYFPCLELGGILIQCISNEHQIISIEERPQHTSAKLQRKHFWCQEHEQWSKNRTWTHTNLHAKLLTVLNIDSHVAPHIEMHPWITCTDHFLTMKLLGVNHRTFLGT